MARSLLACPTWCDLQSWFCLGREKTSPSLPSCPKAPCLPSPLGPQWSGSFLTSESSLGNHTALRRQRNHFQPARRGWKTLVFALSFTRSPPQLLAKPPPDMWVTLVPKPAGSPESLGLRTKVLSAMPFGPVSLAPSPSDWSVPFPPYQVTSPSTDTLRRTHALGPGPWAG